MTGYDDHILEMNQDKLDELEDILERSKGSRLLYPRSLYFFLL